MINYFIFNKTTGEILRTGTCLTKEALEDQNNFLQSNEGILEGVIDLDTTFIDINTYALKNIPKKPSEYHKFNFKDEQWELDYDLLENDIKFKRNTLLTYSDWTDTVSAQTRLTNYAEWQIYRQALRDITKQEGYPLNVIWPTQPN